MTGLLDSGATKEVPIWYDVYKKYPPDLEPYSDRPLPPQDPVLELVYPEDFDRVKKPGKSESIGKARRTAKLSGKKSSLVTSIVDEVLYQNK